MTFQDAMNEIRVHGFRNVSDAVIDVIAGAIARNSERGQWYDGPNSTNITEWVAEGHLTGNETLDQLVTEWDI